MWECMGPYKFKMFEKETKRSPRGDFSSPKYLVKGDEISP
jgi:hypothetical protein